MRASVAATNSARLLAEFSSERAQRAALRTRQADQALGQVSAGFGASGVTSIGAIQEQQRQNALAGTIAESQANQRQEGILAGARSAIQGALATGVQAAGSLRAASIKDPISRREVNRVNSIRPDLITIGSGSGAGTFRGPSISINGRALEAQSSYLLGQKGGKSEGGFRL
jgi:hypothetical protein